jgi:hypothetical protein
MFPTPWYQFIRFSPLRSISGETAARIANPKQAWRGCRQDVRLGGILRPAETKMPATYRRAFLWPNLMTWRERIKVK